MGAHNKETSVNANKNASTRAEADAAWAAVRAAIEATVRAELAADAAETRAKKLGQPFREAKKASDAWDALREAEDEEADALATARRATEAQVAAEDA